MSKTEASWEYVVVLHFWTFQDYGNNEIGQRFLNIMQRHGFIPDKYGDEDPPKRNFKVSSPVGFLKLWTRQPGQLNLQKLGRMGFQALLHMSGPLPRLVTFALHDEYFQSSESISRFLEFSEELYTQLKPVYGEISHKKDWDKKTVIIEPIRIGDKTVNAEAHLPVQPTKGLPGIFWANYFGPTFVDFYTKAKLASAPGYSKKDLLDGGRLILTSRSPLDYAKPETKKTEGDLIDFLGPDTIVDKTLPDRILRSPFPTLTGAVAAGPSKPQAPTSSISSNLQNCPDCGETKTEEVSRDSVNNLIGFRCLACGARWMVHTSLL